MEEITKEFSGLIHRYERGLVKHLAQFTDDPSVLEDLRQETCLQAFRNFHTVSEPALFFPWLRRIATRVAYRYWATRMRESRAKLAFAELHRMRATAMGKNPRPDGRDQIAALLRDLDESDRSLLELRYIHEMAAADIAKLKGWKTSRVRVRIHRILAALRRRATQP